MYAAMSKNMKTLSSSYPGNVQALFSTYTIVLFYPSDVYIYLSITVKALLSQKYSQESEIFLLHILSLIQSFKYNGSSL